MAACTGSMQHRGTQRTGRGCLPNKKLRTRINKGAWKWSGSRLMHTQRCQRQKPWCGISYIRDVHMYGSPSVEQGVFQESCCSTDSSHPIGQDPCMVKTHGIMHAQSWVMHIDTAVIQLLPKGEAQRRG